MKIKVLSKERCLEIAREKNPGTNLSDDELLEFLPDNVFGNSYDSEFDGIDGIGYYKIFEKRDVESILPYIWVVPKDFVKPMHKVTITETLQREVWVDADSPEEASEIVQREYREQKHVLTADDFAETTFSVETGTVEEV